MVVLDEFKELANFIEQKGDNLVIGDRVVNALESYTEYIIVNVNNAVGNVVTKFKLNDEDIVTGKFVNSIENIKSLYYN